jgi:hypothetical protein
LIMRYVLASATALCATLFAAQVAYADDTSITDPKQVYARCMASHGGDVTTRDGICNLLAGRCDAGLQAIKNSYGHPKYDPPWTDPDLAACYLFTPQMDKLLAEQEKAKEAQKKAEEQREKAEEQREQQAKRERQAKQREKQAKRAGSPLSPEPFPGYNSARDQLEQCWNVPAASRDAKDLTPEFRVYMNRDGTIQSATQLNPERNGDPYFQAAAEAAERALHNPHCQPLGLPPDKYAQWQTFTITFDPKDL